MSEDVRIRAIQIGGLAYKALSAGSCGGVMGVTSSGIFLRAANRIIFVTGADYRSPYNVQVDQYENLAAEIAVGDQWTSEAGALIFNDTNMRIDIINPRIWQPNPLASVDNDPDIQRSRILSLIRRLCELDSNKGWLFLAQCDAAHPLKPGSEAHRIHRMTDDFIHAVQVMDQAGCLASAHSILGLGGGLTPSGDDWLTGFFLYHARRNAAQTDREPFLVDLGEAITDLAFERTTKISANRIEAACQGWAEELFLDVIDCLLVEKLVLSDEKITHLANFGHSSGVDTCMGIWAALIGGQT